MDTTSRDLPDRDPSDALGDAGDQALDLRTRSEQEAIAAALAGHPHGDDEIDRAAISETLEGQDPLAAGVEGDSSDDPVYGGDDVTGLEPPPRPFDLPPDSFTETYGDEDADSLDPYGVPLDDE